MHDEAAQQSSMTQIFRITPEDQQNHGPRLVAISGPRQGLVATLAPGETSIGRRPENTIRLDHPGVSKRHCLIRGTDDGSFSLADHGSRNGTRLNGRPLPAEQTAPLTHGDTITICATSFFFLNPARALREIRSTELRIDGVSAAREAETLLAEHADLLALRRGWRSSC